MPTQKIFKGRVRARMAKTGESYTAARRQLLRKAAAPDAPELEPPAAEPGDTAARVETATPPAAPEPIDLQTSDDAVRRASSKGYTEWFVLLDAWGATDHGHTEIARWLSEAHGVRSWWTQTITVAYERARGMRARHEMSDGFTISVTRTVASDAAQALGAFTDVALRERWLPGAPMRQRPTRAALSARFDWSDPPSRVVVTIVRKGSDKSLVAVAHEQLPDAATAERLKDAWRGWLGGLKAALERD